MRSSVCGWMLAVAGTVMPAVIQAQDLHVKAGTTWSPAETIAVHHFDQLILEDGSRIVLPGGRDFWEIRAERVQVGTGVVIVGGGTPAQAEPHVIPAAPAPACPATPGAAGSAGREGGDAPTLRLDWGVLTWKDLTIELRGGKGSSGGHGGPGGEATPDCSHPQGGTGGAGGPGGAGGRGGRLELVYRLLSSALKDTDVRAGTHVVVAGGLGGAAGEGGRGGPAAAGKYVTRKTLSGDRKWVAGGPEGPRGAVGLVGLNGETGTIMWGPVTPRDHVGVAPDLDALRVRIEALEKQLERQALRLRRLEAQ